MKKLIATLMSLMIVSGLTACGNKDSSSDGKSKQEDSAVSNNDSESNNDEETPEVDDSPITVDDVLNHPETPAEDFEYNDKGGKFVSIEAYVGTDPIVVIPEQINGLPVTVVTATGFNFDSKVKGVSFPSGVTELSGTFNNNKVVQIVVAKGVEEVENYAFINNPKLKYVDLGPNLIEIAECQFISDEELKIHIPESTTKLYDCVMWEETTTIVGKAGSYAEEYAKEYGIKFEEG